MYIKLEDTFRVSFGTVNSSAASANADSLPTIVVLEQGVALGYAPVVTLIATGIYEVTVDATAANGFEVGKEYSAYVTVVMGGVTSKDGLASFNVTTSDVDDINTADALILAAVSNIAVTGAALNTIAASRTITTGAETGTLADSNTADGVYHNVADAAGAIDFYYEFDVSATSGAVGVSAQWLGYVVGLVNTIKVYARNWVGATWDQVGSIVGISGAVNMTDDWELTSAHTQAGLARIRFAATGLVGATVKTDRVLLGYAVVAPTVAAIQSGLATAAALATVQSDTDDIQTRLPAALVGGKMDATETVLETRLSAVRAGYLDNLSAGAVALASALATVQSDTDDIQTRLPAALSGGKMDSHVNDIAANAITAASIATDAIDADALKADAVTEIQSGLATSAALATAQTAITAIKLSTDNLPSDPADESLIIAATNAIAAAVAAIPTTPALAANLATAQGDITAIKAKTDLLPTDPADESLLLAAISAIPTTPALAADLATAQSAITNIQSRIPVALDGDGNMMSSVQSVIAGAIDAASVAAAAVTKIADGVFAYVIESGAPSGARSFIQRLRIEWSVFAAKALGLSTAGPMTESFRDAADTKDRATFTLNTDGTRTPGTLDGD